MRTTITINDTILRALKLRAVESDTSVSQLIEDAVKYQTPEDLQDIKDAYRRQSEPEYAFDDLVVRLRAEGLLETSYDERKGELIVSKPLDISGLSERTSRHIKPGIKPLTNVDEYYQSTRKVNV
jgi:septation ring formation regulator EzrA